MAFGIDMGPSSGENTQYNNLSGASNFATNTGESDISQSGAFMSAILSGDPTKIEQVLGPQIQGIQQQGQQQKQTNAQFGNRSGGTNAKNQTADDNTRTQVNNLVSGLTGTALSGLNSTGTSLLSTGVNGFSTAFGEADTMQQQKASQWNDIFQSIASVVAPFLTPGAGMGSGMDASGMAADAG